LPTEFPKSQRSYSAAEPTFFTSATSLAGWLGIQQILLFAPERRFNSILRLKQGPAGSSPMISGLSQRCVARFARIGSRAQKARLRNAGTDSRRRDRRQSHA